jgi:hypothetical protein
VSRDSVVVVARLTVRSGIEFLQGRDFPRSSRPALGHNPASCHMGTGSSTGLSRPKLVVNDPFPSIAEVKGTVEIICSSSVL